MDFSVGCGHTGHSQLNRDRTIRVFVQQSQIQRVAVILTASRKRGAVRNPVKRVFGIAVQTRLRSGNAVITVQAALHEDFTPLFARIRPIIAGADLALCHLESPLSMDDDDLSFRGTFRVPSSLADAIAGAGYDGCSLASNHALDSGPSSVTATLHHLRRVGLATVGMADAAEAAGPAWFSPGGIRVAHLSVTDLVNGRELPVDPAWMVPHLDVDRVIAEAAAARGDGAEFVVVSVHWGEEYRADPTDGQRSAAERLLAAPEVDLVLGHHAHVVQPVVRHDGDAVAYGLGNLLTNQPGDEANPCRSCPPETQDGLIAWFQVTGDPDGARITDAAMRTAPLSEVGSLASLVGAFRARLKNAS